MADVEHPVSLVKAQPRTSPSRPGTVHEMRGHVLTERQLDELVRFAFRVARSGR